MKRGEIQTVRQRRRSEKAGERLSRIMFLTRLDSSLSGFFVPSLLSRRLLTGRLEPAFFSIL